MLNALAHAQDFVDARSAAESRLTALITTRELVERRIIKAIHGKASTGEQRCVRLGWLAACVAKPAHEALRDDCFDCGCNQEWLNAHVQQTRHGPGRIVGVQRAKHKVTGKRRLDRDLGCLKVSDFTNHNDVGILAEERTQC